MATSKLVASVAKSLAPRSVHIRIHPAPKNIHESRQVLRALKSFGEITIFRSLRYDRPSLAAKTILAVFQEAEAASKLISESPLRFTIEPPPSDAAQFSSPESLAISGPSQDEPGTDGQEFEIRVDYGRQDHASIIQRNEYYWDFSPGKNPGPQEDLARSVPVRGMSYINVNPAEQLNRNIARKDSAVKTRPNLSSRWRRAMEAAGHATDSRPQENKASKTTPPEDTERPKPQDSAPGGKSESKGTYLF